MKNSRDVLATRVNSLIGNGGRFASPAEWAQRALTLGLIDKADSFTRKINRIRNAEVDPMLSTIETLAASASVSIPWLLGLDDGKTLSEPALKLTKAIAEIDQQGGERAETVFTVINDLLLVTDAVKSGTRAA
jgi:hypothetical protein